MDFSKKQQAIFYIEDNCAFFYPGASGEILQFPFPQDVVSDLEVLSRQKLLALVQAFFQVQQILPSEILFVFGAPTVFEKDFPQGENQEAIQQFIEYIPFDEVLTKTFQLNEITRVVAINKQLYESLKAACESVKCHVVGVLVYSSLLQVAPEFSQNVNIPLMLAKFDACKQFNIIAPSQHINQIQQPSTPAKNKRIFVLLGIFGFLLVVLLIVVISTVSSGSHKTNTIKRLPAAVPTTINSSQSNTGQLEITPIQTSGVGTPSATK